MTPPRHPVVAANDVGAQILDLKEQLGRIDERTSDTKEDITALRDDIKQLRESIEKTACKFTDGDHETDKKIAEASDKNKKELAAVNTVAVCADKKARQADTKANIILAVFGVFAAAQISVTVMLLERLGK